MNENDELRSQVGDLKLKIAVVETKLTHLDKGQEDIQSTLRWLVRLVIGAMLMAAVGYGLNGGFAL